MPSKNKKPGSSSPARASSPKKQQQQQQSKQQQQQQKKPHAAQSSQTSAPAKGKTNNTVVKTRKCASEAAAAAAAASLSGPGNKRVLDRHTVSSKHVVETHLHNRLYELPIVELAQTLLVRIFTKKRVVAFIIFCIYWFAARGREDELFDFAMSSSGMRVEDPDRPGLVFDTSAIKSQHPVVVIPGFVTTALEFWKTKQCMQSGVSFRSRLFSAASILTLLRDPTCFLAHLALDPDDGAKDPDPEIMVRHSIGFDAVDFITGGFWVWARAFVNLRDIGYSPRNLWTAAYDWRLSGDHMQERDAYYSRVRARVEAMVRSEKKRVVFVSHSYGAIVLTRLLAALEKQTPGWTEQHVESIFNIAGAALGVAKSVGALASGQVKDTAMLPSVTRRLVDSHVIRPLRAQTMRTWPCLSEMLPRGPPQAWSTMWQWSPATMGAGVGNNNNNNNNNASSSGSGGNLTYPEALRELRAIAADSNSSRLVRELDAEPDRSDVPRLPTKATTTSMFCIYGVGLRTEIGYIFSGAHATPQEKKAQDNKENLPKPSLQDIELDLDNTDGVVFGEGDGTVPLESLGYLCRSKKHPSSYHNQFGGGVTTVELQHQTVNIDPRGGDVSGDHVDIMGNSEMIMAMLRVVSGLPLEEKIVSDIDERTRKLDEQL